MAKTTTKRASKKKLTPAEPVKMTIPAEKPAKTAKVTPKAAPTYDQIAARAYEIWAEKGYPAGQDLENWRQAEAELCGGKLTTAA